MDLLFKRYANPYIFLEEVMECNCFSQAVAEIWNFEQEDINWQFFLHKVFDKSYDEFKEEINSNQEPQRKLNKKDIEATVTKSQNILDGFIPEERSKYGRRNI